MRELLNLYLAFFRIGLFTFGGGYAMLPMLQKEAVEHYRWATDEELADYYAIGQCTPGTIAVNTATFIGNKRRGFAGAAAATAGVVTPSLIIITLIAAFIRNFSDIPWVKHAFAGIRVAVCALIVNAVAKLWKSGVRDAFGVVLFAASVAASVLFSVSPVPIVVLSAAAGILIKKAGTKA